MGVLSLLVVASMPIVQVLLIGMVGAFLASKYTNYVLNEEARKYINRIVFLAFTPCLIFGSLAKTVTLGDIVSWWFMPVNIGLVFFFGGILGWIAVQILRPERHLRGLIIASCSAGNLGNLMIIIIPAICNEDGSPFRNLTTCHASAIAYASFSMAVGAFYVWTHTYHLMKSSSSAYQELQAQEACIKIDNADPKADLHTNLLKASQRTNETSSEDSSIAASPRQSIDICEVSMNQGVATPKSMNNHANDKAQLWKNITCFVNNIIHELLAPPTTGAILGLIVGTVPFLKSLIIGEMAPLRVILESITLLGEGTIPSITLILGGNLTKGLRSGKVKAPTIIAILSIRYIILPAIGILVVKFAGSLGLLPPDPLFNYVLMIQFTLPPAMNIGTMAQLFDVGQQECSIIFLWTYLVAAFALTVWSTVYMWLLSYT